MPAAFCFDLASAWSYIAAERILGVMPGPAEWIPVLARELPGGEQPEQLEGLAETAGELALQELRMPQPFPFDSTMAMRVATYARSIGRTVPFAQAAFRQAYAGGHSLQDPDYVLISAAACEMHPAAVLKGAEMRSVREQLRAVTAQMALAGVRRVPAVLLDGRVFEGPGLIDDAARQMASIGAATLSPGEPSPVRVTLSGPE